MKTEISLGKLIKFDDLRSVWKNEASDFTVWLAEEENLTQLGDTLGIEMELINREEPAGAFSIDIFAEEVNSGRKIIIENQLENSNHDHLGKTITYASAKSAEIIIWIVKNARDEHRQAIEWLNEKTDENIEFYLLEIELWRIGNSDIAPKFNIISAPNGWMKTNKSSAKNESSLKALQLEFWEKFYEYANNNCQYISKKRTNANPRSWYNIGAESKKCYISLSISAQKKQIKAMIYFPHKNRDEFEKFSQYKKEINELADNKLEWIEWKKDCTIKLTENADIMDKSDWERQFKWLCDSCMKLKEIIDKYKED
ncbi:MAG: DUF4268 domain-containing protein [Porcipelethomonas sp.]